MKILYPEIGVCGLSCRLCPRYHTEGESKCGGCKSEGRMRAGCPFITCAVKKKEVEFCWQCLEKESCPKWSWHRGWGRAHDSFICYQKLDQQIDFIQTRGIHAFVKDQKAREKLLKVMLTEFNEGRSKTYYSIAATVMDVKELERAISLARKRSGRADVKGKAMTLHDVLDAVAQEKRYHLKLRK